MTPEQGQTMPNSSVGETLRNQLGQVMAPIQEADASAAAAMQAAEEAAQTAASVRADAQEGVQKLAADVSDAATAIQEVANQLNPNVPGTIDDAPEVPEETVVNPAADKEATVFDRIRGSKTATRVYAVGALAAAVLVVAYGVSKFNGGDKVSTANTPAQLDNAPNNASSSQEQEVQGWEQKELTPNEENKWLENGFPQINKANSAEESREAANQWLGVIKGDKETFSFVASELLGGEVDKNSIFDENGNSTDTAEELLKKVQLKLAVSNIGKGSASKDLKNPHNTALSKNGQVAIAEKAGVSGDTEAIIVETPDGKKIAIMHRCAQPVVEGDRPNVPKGPTDEDTPKPPKKKVPSKYDDDKLPGNPNVPADQDGGTPDNAGKGPAGQTQGSDGYVPGENKPNKPTPKPTPAPLPQAPETRPPQAPAQENQIPPVTGPGTPGNGSGEPTPTEDVEIK